MNAKDAYAIGYYHGRANGNGLDAARAELGEEWAEIGHEVKAGYDRGVADYVDGEAERARQSSDEERRWAGYAQDAGTTEVGDE
jgi:hypothetical protein